MTREPESYAGQYEAYFHLIALETPQLLLPSEAYCVWAHCLDEFCENADGTNWTSVQSSQFDARQAGLEHCRERHTFGGAS